jgi:prepilin-type N-terminal cleavage/methylation domain-containing protein
MRYASNNQRSQRSQRSQRGDTLIEVLICVLVVTLILVGAYVTTHQATLGVRNSQEHAEALKLVQSQLEMLRQDASKPAGSKVFTITPPFCMVNSEAMSTTIAPGLTDCIQNSSGQATEDGLAYELSIERSDCSIVAANCRLFTVKATWDTITNNGKSTELMTYRLYK